MTNPSDALALFGGKPGCDQPWPAWPVFDDAERRSLSSVLESGQWWFGEKVRAFEAAYAAFQGAQYAVTCTNGTTALEMGLRALGIVEGDEVIVPPYSFIATASAVVTVGGIPVFADIQPDTLCIDPEDVERKIGPRTKAIIPVHVAGYIASMDEIRGVADRYQLRVLEDAAHAWGSQWQHQGAGTLGDCGTFSFQISKNITAGEGGILVTNNEDLADLCRSYTHCGRMKNSAWYDHAWLGSNLRMTEFQAALLLAQLGRLEAQLQRREASAAILDQALQGLPGIRLLAPARGMTRRSYHMYVFRIREADLGISRGRFIEALNAEGIPASVGWSRPLYANDLFRNAHQGPAHGIRAPLANKGVDYRLVSCPACKQVCQDAVWIPQHVLLADPDKIHLAAEAIAKVVRRADSLRNSW